MEKIESGKLLEFLKKFWKSLEKEFDKFDYEIKDQQQTETGGMHYEVTKKGKTWKIEVTCEPIDNSNTEYKCTFKTEGKPEVVRNHVKYDKVIDECEDVAEQWFGSDDVKSGTILANFKKLQATKQVKLTAIKASAELPPEDVISAVFELVNSPEFTDTVDNETYEIVPMDDEIAVTPYDDTLVCTNTLMHDSIYQILNAEWCAYLNTRYLLYFYEGSAIPADARRVCEDIMWTATSQIDILSRLSIELSGTLDNPSTCIKDSTCYYEYESLTDDERMTYVKGLAESISAAIDAYYCNFSQDVKTMLDEWQRGWKCLINYTLRNVEELTETRLPDIAPYI